MLREAEKPSGQLHMEWSGGERAGRVTSELIALRALKVRLLLSFNAGLCSCYPAHVSAPFSGRLTAVVLRLLTFSHLGIVRQSASAQLSYG